MYFTLEDFEKIENYLRSHSLRDSELSACNPLTGTELIVILLSGRNVLTTINELISLTSGNLVTIGAPTFVYDSTNDKITIKANVSTALYYSINSTNEDAFLEYTAPLTGLDDGDIIRAYAYYKNGSKELTSETSSYTYSAPNAANISTLLNTNFYWGYIDASMLDTFTPDNYATASDGSSSTAVTSSFNISGDNKLFYVMYPINTSVYVNVYDSSIGAVSINWATKQLTEDWNLQYFILDNETLKVKNITFIK